MNRRHAVLCVSEGDDRNCAACAARQLSICAHMDREGLAKLKAISRTVTYRRGALIFEQDMDLEWVFIVCEGLIKLYRELPEGERQITGFLGPGDILGGIKRDGGAHCTAEALTDVEVCAFERNAFVRLVQDYPSLSVMLLFAATDEIEAQNDHLILLGRKRAPARLAAFLLILSHRWGGHEQKDAVVKLPMSRADIADYLGLTIETVSRTFALLKAKKFIATPKPSIVILRNPAALYDLAGLQEIATRRVAVGL